MQASSSCPQPGQTPEHCQTYSHFRAACPQGQRTRDVKGDNPCLPQGAHRLTCLPLFPRAGRRTSHVDAWPWRASPLAATPLPSRNLAHPSAPVSGHTRKAHQVPGDTKAMTWTQQPALTFPEGLEGHEMGMCWACGHLWGQMSTSEPPAPACLVLAGREAGQQPLAGQGAACGDGRLRAAAAEET